MTAYEIGERILPPERRWLGLICLFSLGLHSVFFFLFQVEVQPKRERSTRPPRVFLLTNQSRADAIFESNPMVWVDWRDPMAIAYPEAAMPEPPRPNRPQETAQNQALPTLPEWNPLLRPGSQVEPGLEKRVAEKMKTSKRTSMPLPLEAPPKLSGTVVQFQGALRDRVLVKKVEMPRPPTSEILKPSEYFVMVGRGGQIARVRLDRTSGNSALDIEGMALLRQWQFEAQSNAKEDEWSRAVIYWDYRGESPTAEFQF